MDATVWSIVGATITILIAVGAAFRSLRMEIREQRKELGERIDSQGKELGERINDLRERMAKLEGLLEGLRESITGKRAA